MFGLFKKKKDKTIRRLKVSIALGHHIVIEVGTGTDLILYRYDLQKGELEHLTKTYTEITEIIEARLDQATELIHKYTDLAKENDKVEAKVFKGLLDTDQQKQEFKKLTYRKLKLENEIKRTIQQQKLQGQHKQHSYKGRNFKIRIHARLAEARS